MKLIHLIFLFTLLSIQGLRAQDQPNVLILYADDMGFGDLTANNPNSKIPTPNLDQLVSEGMRFTNGHSSSGVCSPSRYALLTGRYHWRKFHRIVEAWGECEIDDDQLTIAEMFKAKGYQTAAIGKWHLGMNWRENETPNAARIDSEAGKGMSPESFDWSKPVPNPPTKHGFDYYFGDGVINFPPYTWIENDKVLKAPDRMWSSKGWKKPAVGTWGARPGPMAEGWNPYDNIPTVTEKALAYIKARSKNKEPFFMYFAFPSPHFPLLVPDEYEGKSKAGPYGDYVYLTDDYCGKILKTLERLGLKDNTIVVFTTDNGAESLAYKTELTYGHWPSAPFRGVKRDIYEGGHHLPFVVRWPAKVKAGQVSNALVSQIDLMATFADVLNYTIPKGQADDSQSFLPLILGQKQTHRHTLVHNTRDDQWAIRKDDWVLVNVDHVSTQIRERAKDTWFTTHGYPTSKKSINELYNLADDIGQRHNVSAQYPEIVQELREELKSIQKHGIR